MSKRVAADDLLTAEELAAQLRVAPNSVRRWTRNRDIPFIQLGPGCRRYRLADVVRTIAAKNSTAEVASHA